jgi:hypothetical protein
VRRLALAVCLVAVLAACGPVRPLDKDFPPACTQRGLAGSYAVVLIAQAVPSATLLPCIREPLPPGWEYSGQDVRSGVARFWLTSDRAGDRAVEVVLTPACEVGGATLISPSDQSGTRRFERVDEVRTGYRGARMYTFDGGCITYVFNFDGPARGTPQAEVTLALDFVARGNVAATLGRVSRGRLRLDPPAE